MMDDVEEALAEWDRQCEYLPEATPNPCNECPWVRTATKGWLGPHTAEEWVQIAHGEGAIACHKTIEESGPDWHDVKQCRGAAIYRSNVLKTHMRNPLVIVGPRDHERVFSTPMEFKEHHDSPLAEWLKENQ